MMTPIPLRRDFDSAAVRRLARASRDAAQTRRLLALAVIYEGGSRSDAARLGGVTVQVIRDRVLRFNADGPDGLIDRKAPGTVRPQARRPSLMTLSAGRWPSGSRPDRSRRWTVWCAGA